MVGMFSVKVLCFIDWNVLAVELFYNISVVTISALNLMTIHLTHKIMDNFAAKYNISFIFTNCLQITNFKETSRLIRDHAITLHVWPRLTNQAALRCLSRTGVNTSAWHKI